MHDLKRPTEAVPADQQDAPERSPVDFSDYGRARYMALDTRPVTEEARGLVQVIAARIEDWEQRSGARRYRRGRDTCEVFRQGVARFIGDLAIAADQDVRRWSFRLMSRGSFTGDEVSYRLFRAVFTALTELGMLDVLPGYYHREWAYGKATRLRATKELLELFEQHGVVRPHSDQHFQRGLPTRPLVLKARSTRMGHLKVSGRRFNFVHTDHTHRLKSEVHDLNRFIASHDLEGGTHRGYRRIFNCGDDPDFDWNKGGRLYSLGEDSYQRLKKEERLRMLIDGEPVVEIDVRASFLTILYAMNGTELDLATDPYDIDGLPRAVVKAWIMVTMGHDKFPQRWPSEIRKDFQKVGIEIGRAYPMRLVRDMVLSAHPVLADWPEQSVTCFDLMYLESAAVMNTMLRLMREKGVVSLSVHDSLVVSESQTDMASRVLRHEYRRAVGVLPSLRIN